MEQALAADDARVQKRAEQSIHVMQLAGRTYDEQRGRCDWELVARDMGMSLIGCLRLFDPSVSTVPVRSLPNITDWLAEDISTLKSAVSEKFGVVTADEWRLIGVYMNIEQPDCFMAHNICTFSRMTPDMYKAIIRHKNDGLKWKDIFELYPIPNSVHVLRDAYHRFKKRDDSKPKTLPMKWSDADTRLLKELVQTYDKPGNRHELLTRAQAAFPNRSQKSILDKSRQIISKPQVITNDAMDRVNKLVDAYGKDWARIGQEIDVSPRRAQRIWTLHQERQKVTLTWTENELDILRKCIHDGVGMAEASRRIGTKTQFGCYFKEQSLKRAMANNTLQKSKTPWNADDVARVLHLVSTYKRGEIDWTAIGKDIGRTVSSCKTKHGELQRNRINSMDNHSQAVSHEVQKQYEQQQSVDWAKIAQQLNLSERECLEANQFNDGKIRWIYHPDEFSWDMANRMTTFIKDNYPKPLPINYTAVSNYMWIGMSDCVKMASLLRGEMNYENKA
ncbi:hypothetical protein J3F82_002167 [Coemansia sp. RSA 637]|nr:hypothetical protein J3F82_002167 [Coemansia sp. RSA 637]